ncbi:MAG: hypothetical protein V3U74_00255 [Thermodesulfobacteriota bacterium]
MFRKTVSLCLVFLIVSQAGCQGLRYPGPAGVNSPRNESDEWRVIETIDNAPVVSDDEIKGIVVEPKAAVPPEEEAPVKSLKKRNVILFIAGVVAVGIIIAIVSMAKGDNGGGEVIMPPDDVTPPNGEPIDDIVPEI